MLRFALVCVLLMPAAALAQASLVNGFGGTAGYGTACLGPNDDGSSRVIDLTPIFPTGIQFFDQVHTTMYVNTNGNVTFDDGVPTYTPAPFPIANRPMIAPYWADVDIRPANGTCGGYPDGTGRNMYVYAGNCQNPAQDGVWWHLDTANRRVIVTWDRVGYYRCHDNKRMSFQLILTAVDSATCGAGSDFDVEFRFNRCEWTTGDASGGQNGDPRPDADCVEPIIGPAYCPYPGGLRCEGRPGDRTCSAVPAQSGFDAGNLMDFVQIMGSRTPEIADILCTDSNVSMPGIWQFQIRSGVIECPDAGAPCATGMVGACATGRMQCVGAGLECRQEVQASTERCDGVDNDCNGTVDDGTLCPDLQQCMAGVCVGSCFEGGCPVGQVCTATGDCVDEGCEGVTCPESERCIDGACVEACSGVVCPAGLTCRAGSCVDLCANATCDECTACVDGDCVPGCQFQACPAGQACQADGTCIEAACDGVSCATGEVCQGGACVDACTGAVCPTGEVCTGGRCIAADQVDAGPPPDLPDAGSLNDGGPLPPPDGGLTLLDASGPPVVEDTGCGCRTVGADRSMPLGLLVMALVAIVIRVRRRR